MQGQGARSSLDEPRMDIPDPELPELLSPINAEDLPPNDLQKTILHRIIARELQKVNYPSEQYQQLYDEHFGDVRTMREMNEAKERVLEVILGG